MKREETGLALEYILHKSISEAAPDRTLHECTLRMS